MPRSSRMSDSSDISADEWIEVAYLEDEMARTIQAAVRRKQHAKLPHVESPKCMQVGIPMFIILATASIVATCLVTSLVTPRPVAQAPLRFLAAPLEAPPPPPPLLMLSSPPPMPPRRIAMKSITFKEPENASLLMSLLRIALQPITFNESTNASLLMNLFQIAVALGAWCWFTAEREIPKPSQRRPKATQRGSPTTHSTQTEPTEPTVPRESVPSLNVPCVRTNSAGRPIDANGRFVAIEQARALGWVDANPLVVPQTCARKPRARPVAKPAAPTAQKTLTWNSFQRATAGHGLTRSQVALAWSAHKNGATDWNKFRSAIKGAKCSPEQISSMYRAQKAAHGLTVKA